MSTDVGRGPTSDGADGLPLFFGGGEVGAVMAGWDWSSTSVGPPATWPPLLQTLVRVLLTSRFPMWLGFGPDLAFFYNDAYRRDTLGVKHPWALGRPAWEVWEEIWPDIGPRVDAVLRTGEATWDEALQLFLERSGYPEETYHTFSYSPVIETDGRIMGMLCVVTEETDRVVGERRMTTLRNLASELSGTRNEAEVFEAVRARLGDNPRDLPFTAVYVFDDDGATARLRCATGIAPGHPAAPGALDASAGEPWPVDALLRTGGPVVVDGLRARLGSLPTGAWDVEPDTALLVPLSRQGQTRPGGFLVAAVNPFRPVDEAVVGFVDLLAGQVAAGLASARAFEAERRRAESLAELDRAKTEFFSNVSHEFRTPLTLILGPAEDSLNDDRDTLPPIQAARLEVIRRNARRLRRLVDDMLDFARIEGGRLRAETVRVDLARLTRDIASSFAPAIDRAGLSFTVECPPLERPAHVDPDMWEKIVLNLLSNALKFTLRGGVTLTLRDAGERVELVVADTGVGIAPDQLPLLFQRFHRAPRTQARSHEGTGIGLALVHELVRLHGGEVTVVGQEGEGSAFTVSVPFGAGPTAQSSGQRESSRQAYLDEALQWSPVRSEPVGGEPGGAARPSAPTVLVVDDNPDMREYIARLLEPYWRVATAPDGVEALAEARRARPDLVLTDVMMPHLDGFGLLEALRADPLTATVPVVFLSARAGEDAAVEGLDAGADDYLVKPFSALELLARVRSNLELAGLRNEETAWRRALVESLREGVAVLDHRGSVVEVNPAFGEILGYGVEGVPYRPPFPWLPDARSHPEDRALAEGALAEVLRSGSFQGAVPARHRDGHPLVVEVAVDSVTADDQRRSVVTFRDISAELVAAGRESALAQLGIRLAEAGHAPEVREVGLTELHRVFGAARVVLQWRSDGSYHAVSTDGAGPEALADGARTALGEAARHGRVEVVGAAGAAAAAEGDPVAGMAAPLAPGGDLGAVWLDLGRPRRVPADDRALFGVLCGYVGQALRRAQLLDDSQTVATAMQRAILGPSQVPPGVAVRYVPAVRPLEVGGDWYDAVELPGDRLGLVVGDCVGRGLEAATVMGQLRSACRALLLQTGGPAATLTALDEFAARIPGAVCTTVCCAVLDRATDELRYSSAGHPPAVVVSGDGTGTELGGARSLPLGVAPGAARPEAAVTVGPGDVLLLYTDGLIERRDESLETGIRRLLAVAAAGTRADGDELADALMAGMLPPEGQRDDVALVVYRPPPAVPPDFRASVPAESTQVRPLRHALLAWLADAGVGEPEATEITVACGEACSNAIEHAYGFDPARRVEVTARIRAGRVQVEVADTGGWRSPGPRTEERGRGIGIMEQLMDEVTLESGPSGTTVRFTRGLPDG